MVFTTVAYSESQAASGLTLYAAVPDEHVTVSGDDITVPTLSQVIAVQCFSANLQAARLVSPSLRRVWNYDIFPFLPSGNLLTEQAVNEGGTATYNIEAGQGFCDMHTSPLPLVVSEKLNLKMDNGGNAEQGYGIVWLADGPPTPERGEIFTIKATASTTLTANAWTNASLTMEQNLPAGRYRVVGMAAKSAGLVAARLVFVGGTWRPGCLGKIAYNDKRPRLFRYGNLGAWGEFEFDQPPSVDFLSASADTSEEVWLDLIQVRAGR